MVDGEWWHSLYLKDNSLVLVSIAYDIDSHHLDSDYFI